MNLKDINNKKIAIHCETQKQSRYLCNDLYELDICWPTSKSALNNSYWYYFQENTCYSIENNTIFIDHICWVKENDYTIIKYEEL